MTSDAQRKARAAREAHEAHEAFVWIWLPGRTQPVVAGRVYQDGGRFAFNYGRSYLDRQDKIPVYAPELPLGSGSRMPAPGLSMAGSLRDASPDAWGRRVILNRMLSHGGDWRRCGAARRN